MHLVTRPATKSKRVIALAAGVLLSLLSAPASALEGPLLSAPTQQIDRVLPRNVLDQIQVPAKPVRVAARPSLDWRPGLSAASEKLAEPAASAKKVRPSLRPVAEPPRLVAPRTEIAKPAAPKTTTRKPKETDPLPLVTPRTERKITPDPTITPIPEPEEKPVEPAPATEAEVSDQGTKAEAEEAPKSKSPEPAKKHERPRTKRYVAPKKEAKEPPAPLSRGLRNLRSRTRTVLSFYYRQPMNTAQNDPWELMHSMLSYELHSRVRDGGPRGQYMTAVGHLCFNRPSKRQQMMVLTDDGKIDVQVGVGLQGHKGQLLAMLAQCNVSPDYPIRVQGKEFEIHDLIDSEQLSCYAKTELTFKLIGLGHYLESDARWLSEDGQNWDIPRLIEEERNQPIRGAACGGTHRLAGLSLAFRRREARGEPVDGEYAKAAKFVSQYQSYAFKLQNEDGSLSTEWFRGRGAEEDIDRRLRTTGHLLEWLVYSLPDEQLTSYRTVRAVNYLTGLLAGNADHEWHPGSLAHAIHALVLYDKRVFRPHDDASSRIAGAVDPTGKLFRGYPIYRGIMRNSPPEPSGLFGIFGGTRTGSAASRRR